MRTVSDAIADGFYLKDVTTQYSNIAELSLKSAFISYFQTAEDCYKIYLDPNTASLLPNDRDALYVHRYALNACNAITHFQHFLELLVKDILLSDSDLLVYDTKKKYDILYKMIHGNPVQEAEYDKLKFIEFSEARDRLEALLPNFPVQYQFLSTRNYFNLMDKVNYLRNKIAHRGAFVIHPEALDELFCGYIIPFVKDIEANISTYSNTLKFGFNIHTTGFDPYSLLASEFQGTSINRDKVLVLKLAALSAYKNDIPYFPKTQSSDPVAAIFNNDYSFLFDGKKQKIEAAALASADWGRLEKCPICGCDSFILEYDSNDFYDDKGNEYSEPYVYEAHCSHCGFHLSDRLLDLPAMGLSLSDYSKV